MSVTSIQEVEEALSLCSLRVAGRLFGIDTRVIREVLGKAPVQRVPLAPAYVDGVLAYRGEVVTAVGLRALLGTPPQEGRGCVLVLDGEDAEDRFGLVVDGVGGVVMAERRMLAANPATLDEASRVLFAGAYRTQEGLMVRLNPEQLRPSRIGEGGWFERRNVGVGGSRCER